MAVTAATIKALFPEFQSLPAARIDLFIDQAEKRVSSEAWGDTSDDGISYLTAHLLSTFGVGGPLDNSGPTTAEQVGDISRSMAVGDMFINSQYGTTPYGRTFLEMRSEVFACRTL